MFTPGRHVQFEMVLRAKTRLEAEIVEIKLEGQDLTHNLHDYKGHVSVVEANLEMPSVHDEDHMEMEMYLHEWQWEVKTLRKISRISSTSWTDVMMTSICSIIS